MLGIIGVLVADSGPEVVVNCSHLDEVSGTKLAISGMTAMGLGSSKRGHMELHGPISVPDAGELQAFYFPFVVSGAQSEDDRVRKHGRECAFFLIFEKSQKALLLNNYEMIERVFRIQSLAMANEDDLNEPRCERLMQIIYRFSGNTSAASSLSERIGTGVFAEVPDNIDERIELLVITQDILSEELERLGISLERTPLLKAVNQPEPLAPADLEVIEASSLMINLLRSAIRDDPSTTRGVLSYSVLVRMGNFLLWRAREMKSQTMLEQASQAFQAACALQESALLRFSIAACLLKVKARDELLEKVANNLERAFALKAEEKFNFTFILSSEL
ncbi:MAG: hypothetical protein ACFFB3_06185 [Candidatus Hodarchaeota archaeon]